MTILLELVGQDRLMLNDLISSDQKNPAAKQVGLCRKLQICDWWRVDMCFCIYAQSQNAFDCFSWSQCCNQTLSGPPPPPKFVEGFNHVANTL